MDAFKAIAIILAAIRESEREGVFNETYITEGKLGKYDPPNLEGRSTGFLRFWHSPA